ncbi:MAG: hypothetical protein Q4A41_05430, partial [Bacillota bacterium]|nr:hypothetical protein [Bacillota bacterium]
IYISYNIWYFITINDREVFMGCKVKCMYYSEECADYCKYAAILSSEMPYAKMMKDTRVIYGYDDNDFGPDGEYHTLF